MCLFIFTVLHVKWHVENFTFYIYIFRAIPEKILRDIWCRFEVCLLQIFNKTESSLAHNKMRMMTKTEFECMFERFLFSNTICHICACFFPALHKKSGNVGESNVSPYFMRVKRTA